MDPPGLGSNATRHGEDTKAVRIGNENTQGHCSQLKHPSAQRHEKMWRQILGTIRKFYKVSRYEDSISKTLNFQKQKSGSLILQSNTFNSKTYTRLSAYDHQALDEDMMRIWLRPQKARNTGAPCSHRASVEWKRAGSQRAVMGIWTGNSLSAHPLIRATSGSRSQAVCQYEFRRLSGDSSQMNGLNLHLEVPSSLPPPYLQTLMFHTCLRLIKPPANFHSQN